MAMNVYRGEVPDSGAGGLQPREGPPPELRPQSTSLHHGRPHQISPCGCRASTKQVVALFPVFISRVPLS